VALFVVRIGSLSHRHSHAVVLFVGRIDCFAVPSPPAARLWYLSVSRPRHRGAARRKTISLHNSRPGRARHRSPVSSCCVLTRANYLQENNKREQRSESGIH
jgi:hypothetical protein